MTIGAEHGGAYDLPEPDVNKASSSFLGWFTKKSGGIRVVDGSSVVTFLGKSQTLYARWTTTNKTVNFNTNGGSFINSADKSRVVPWGNAYSINSPLPTVNAPIHEPALYFTGWYTARTGGIQVDETTILTFISSSQTLYARWTTVDPS